MKRQEYNLLKSSGWNFCCKISVSSIHDALAEKIFRPSIAKARDADMFFRSPSFAIQVGTCLRRAT